MDSVEVLAVIFRGQVFLEQVGIISDLVSAHVDGPGAAEDVGQLVEHIMDHLPGLRLPDIHRGAGGPVGVVILPDHIGIEVFQLRVFIPVAHGIENGDDLDIVVLRVFDQFLPFFLGHRVGVFSRSRIPLILEGVLHIGHINVAFYKGHPSDDILEVLQRGDLASGDIIGYASERHGRPVPDLQRADLAAVQLKQLRKGHQAVVCAAGGRSGYFDTVGGYRELIGFGLQRTVGDMVDKDGSRSADDLIRFLHIAPDTFGKGDVLPVDDDIPVTDLDMRRYGDQIQVHIDSSRKKNR